MIAQNFNAPTVAGTAVPINQTPVTTYMRQPGAAVPSPYPAPIQNVGTPRDESWMMAINRRLEQLNSPNQSQADADITGMTSDKKAKPQTLDKSQSKMRSI